MKTTILSEYGFHEALLGMGLSHGKTSGITSLWDIRDDASLKERALKLAGLGSGHDKFLRMIVVTLDITAPLYWWKQFDTYKVGTVAQSESTMHTLMKKPLTPEMFESGLFPDLVRSLNVVGKQDGFETLNRCLPHSFLHRAGELRGSRQHHCPTHGAQAPRMENLHRIRAVGRAASRTAAESGGDLS